MDLDGDIGARNGHSLFNTIPGLVMEASHTLLPILTITKRDLYCCLHFIDEESFPAIMGFV